MRFFSALLVVSLFPMVAAAQDFDEVEIKTTSLTESLFMLEGSGGNIGVCIGEDGTFIIDDQFAPLTDKIEAAIAELTDQPVQFVVNTHFHYDHTDGNENFGEAGALIVAHDNSRTRMATDQVIQLFDREQEAYSADGLPKITFAEAMTFHYNGETIELYHWGPAHTDGDVVIRFVESNVVHTGDVFVRYGFPFIDEPNGGHIDGMIRTVEHIIELLDEETKVIPGHGQVATRQDVIDFNEMLKTIRVRVQAEIDAGKTLEEVVASNPVRGFEERGIETPAFIKIVFDSLQKPLD